MGVPQDPPSAPATAAPSVVAAPALSDPNRNDLIWESELVKVEFDKTCWGPNKWAVFARPFGKARWILVAECDSEAAAMEAAKDPDRTEPGDLARTEVERQRMR